MKQLEKTYDHYLNNKNKYSIRKFTVGTASIIVGSLLFLGIHNDVEAAENTIDTNVATQPTSQNPTLTTTATTPTDNNVLTAIQPSESQPSSSNNQAPTVDSAPKSTSPTAQPSEKSDTLVDPIDTNDVCYIGENPTTKGVGVNPTDGVFVKWENSFDNGDFSGAVDKTKTIDHVYSVAGTTQEEIDGMVPGGQFDAGSVKYDWKDKEIPAGSSYEGWSITDDSVGKSFTVTEPGMPTQVTPGQTNFIPEKTAIYVNPLGKSSMDSTGDKVPALVGLANWKTNSGNGYRSLTTTRYIQLGVQGTKVKSQTIPVNPDSLVRLHFSYRGVFGSIDGVNPKAAYETSEQGRAYLIDAATGKKLENQIDKEGVSTVSGYYGWTYGGTIYKIPDNVKAVNIVLEAGDKAQGLFSAYPDDKNLGYLFDNVGLELGPALESTQTLTRIAPDGTAQPAYYGQNKIYKRGDTLQYKLETTNTGYVDSDDNDTKIIVPEGLTLKGDLPEGYTYDAATRTITVPKRNFNSTGSVSTIQLDFTVDNDITKDGIYFESFINFKFSTYFYGNAISDGSNIQHQTCYVGTDQKIYLDTIVPKAPTVDTIDTVAKAVPVTPPTDTDVNKLEMTFPGKIQPVTLTKNPEGQWLLEGTPVLTENEKLNLPIPTDVTLTPDTKITAVAYDIAGNVSEPGQGDVIDTPPVIDATDTTIVRGTKSFATPADKESYIKSLTTVSDKEDDTSTTDNKNTTLEVVSNSNFDPKVAGTYEVTVKATDGDGKSTTKTFTITVTPNDADNNTPSYNADQTKPGNEVTVTQTGDKELPDGTTFSVDPKDVPEGWTVTVDPKTGDVKAIPDKDTEPGTSVDIPVKVTYPDGSVDIAPAHVSVVPTDADTNDPAYGDTTTTPGDEVTVPQTGDKTLPDDTTFSVDPKDVPEGWTVTVDPKTSDLTVVPGKDVKPGTSVDIPVKVTYPDGSVETIPAHVSVIPTDADLNDPAYGDATTKPGQPVTVPQTGDKTLPDGTTFSVDPKDVPEGWVVSVDPKTGDVKAIPDKDTEPGTSVDIPVKVTYPDGSVETIPAHVSVVPADADTNDPAYGDTTTTPGDEVTVPQTGDKTLPDGTTFSVDPKDVPEGWVVSVDPKTGDVKAIPDKDTEPGTSVDIPVKVTYPDGSVETIPAHVSVVPTDADTNDPAYGDTTTTPGDEVTVPQTGDKTLPDGTTFSVDPKDVPEGWVVSVDPTTGEVSVTAPKDAVPGTVVQIPVLVTYPDGTTEVTTVTFTVVPLKDTCDTGDKGIGNNGNNNNGAGNNGNNNNGNNNNSNGNNGNNNNSNGNNGNDNNGNNNNGNDNNGNNNNGNGNNATQSDNASKQSSKKSLPDTGVSQSSVALVGLLVAAAGLAFLRRRKKAH